MLSSAPLNRNQVMQRQIALTLLGSCRGDGSQAALMSLAQRACVGPVRLLPSLDPQAAVVTRLIHSGRVRNYPPCVHCGDVDCRCVSNGLSRQDLAEWCLLQMALEPIAKGDDQTLHLLAWTGRAEAAVLTVVLPKIHSWSANFPARQAGTAPILQTLALEGNAVDCVLVNGGFARRVLRCLGRIETTVEVWLQRGCPELGADFLRQSLTIHRPEGMQAFSSPKPGLRQHVRHQVWQLSQQSRLWHWICQDGQQNVGDLVGAYLFEKITGRALEYVHPSSTSDQVFLTCGSIISDANIQSGNAVIWGSGILSKQIQPFKAQVHAVRGFQSKIMLDLLGVACPPVFGDPALLMPRFYKPDVGAQVDIGIIMHWSQPIERIRSLIEKIEAAGLSWIEISVHQGVEFFSAAIFGCRYTITTSLHGVVFSHAYHVPSLPFFLQDSGKGSTRSQVQVQAQVQSPGQGTKRRNLSGETQFLKFYDYYSFFNLLPDPIYFLSDFIESQLDLIDAIESYPQPEFPFQDRLDPLLRSCPFLPCWDRY